MLGAPHGQVSDPPSRHEFIYVVLRRESSAAATASCANCSCGCSESDALDYVHPASEGDRVRAVKDVSATGRVEDWDVKAGLVLTVRGCCIAKPHAIRTVGDDDGGSPIIPERIHDDLRLRFTCQTARKSHRQDQMLHLFE